ncbi:uncharacterized protein SCHCODRAFT_02541509 [Schizophyllum commune H4-8]|nr:uncharacterized protein SCHCODRAFT_02541509 [Schizophyllum commune H4-8]KAI5892111.1 hypothetical protein SCHCODRAFT_02541509 [Schizophyllum commune H4-8]
MALKLLPLATLAITAQASGTTYCETYVTTSATTYYPYPGSTVTVTVDGATTIHRTSYVYETPMPTLPRRAANTPPCNSTNTVTRTEFTTVPNPTWTATWTEWATTVTGEPVTITVPAV